MQNGTGASVSRVSAEDKALGAIAADTEAQNEVFESLNELLLGHGGESEVMENLLEHFVTRITDEGLVIEVYSRDTLQIFDGDSATATPLLQDLATLIAQVSKTIINDIAIGSHVRARPLVLVDNPVWDRSQQRATQMLLLTEHRGIEPKRIQRVTGHADREHVVRDPMLLCNERIEIVLLRNIP